MKRGPEEIDDPGLQTGGVPPGKRMIAPLFFFLYTGITFHQMLEKITSIRKSTLTHTMLDTITPQLCIMVEK